MFVPESCELNREVQREALTGVPIGQPQVQLSTQLEVTAVTLLRRPFN